jgi:hypothetical protein
MDFELIGNFMGCLLEKTRTATSLGEFMNKAGGKVNNRGLSHPKTNVRVLSDLRKTARDSVAASRH